MKKLLIPIMLLFATECSAQWVVIDPTNLVENILQAARALQSNINEAKMIANQIRSLANEALNLESLSTDIIGDFNSQFDDLFSVMGEISGLMQDLYSAEERFGELYPEYQNLRTQVSRTELSYDSREWVLHTREMMLGLSKTGGQVLENLYRSRAELDALLSSSQSAVGILQAAQAGNQIAGTISGNLINLNAQLASYTQAHTALLMEINSSEAASFNRMDHVMDDWGRSHRSRPMAENPF